MSTIIAGKPVTGKQFVGRKKELELLKQLVLLGQSVVVIAPRRFGKTSLLMELLNKLRTKEMFEAFVDVFSTPTIDELSETITTTVLNNKKLSKIIAKLKTGASEVLTNVQIKATVEDFEFIAGFAGNKPDYWKILKESILFIDEFAIHHHKKMICVFDEFGDIKKLNGDKIVKMFRAGLQKHENTVCIFSGSYESVMQEMFVNKSAPFFRFARIVQLGFIEKSEFKTYYSKILSNENIEVSSGYIDKILEFTKGHPYYSQLVIQQIVLNYKTEKKVLPVNELINELLIIENSYLEKVWEDVKNNKENVKVLIALARSKKGIYTGLKNKGINVARAINKLIGAGLIFREKDKQYQFTDPLFELWIRIHV